MCIRGFVIQLYYSRWSKAQDSILYLKVDAQLVLNLVWIAHVTLCVQYCLYRGGRPAGAGHTSEIYKKVHLY